MKAYDPLYKISKIYQNLISGTPFSRGGGDFSVAFSNTWTSNCEHNDYAQYDVKLFKGVPFNMKKLITIHVLNISPGY